MEAELIGYAVQHGLSLGEQAVLMVDIGGSSVNLFWVVKINSIF